MNCLLIVVAIVIGMILLCGMPIGTAVEVVIGLAILLVFLFVVSTLLSGGANAVYALYLWFTKGSSQQNNSDADEKKPADVEINND